MSEITTVRLSFIIATLLGLAWIGFGIWAMVEEDTLPQTLSAGVQAVGLLLMPVAAFYAFAAALGARERIPVLDRPDPLEDSEARLSGTAARINSLKMSLTDDMAQLAATADLLEQRAAHAQRLAADLNSASSNAIEASRTIEATLPDATSAIEQLRQSLDQTGTVAQGQAELARETALGLASTIDDLQARGTRASDGLGGALADLEAKAERGRTQSEAAMRAIRGEADTLFELLENTLVAKREAMTRQGEAIAAQLSESYARLEAMAAAASGQLSERLGQLAAQAQALEERLQAQGALTDSLAASGERAFKLLDARLQHSQETSSVALDRLSGRVQDVSTELGRLGHPLKESQAATQELEQAVSRLRETTLQTVDVFGETLPARTVEAGRAAETLTSDLMQLVAAIDGAEAKAVALAAPIAESRAALDAASEGYAAQRSAIEAAGQALVVELQQARTLIGEVEEQTRDTSLAAATRLVDAMSRVRDVATQATGTMREMLDGVLAEAREALGSAADDAMRRSFAEPIAARAEEAQAIASAAAERTAASMAALAETLKLLEHMSAERTVQFEQARQADLLAAAALLTEGLSTQAVSIGSALGTPMDDADWAQWRKGERGLFNRRAISLLDRREAKELKELIARDPEFARSAQAYQAGFDALVRRFDAQAPALSAALMGSDHGRLAAALAEVLES